MTVEMIGPVPSWPPVVALPVAMVVAGSTKPAGGEYGDVRASIDTDKLNAYLANNVPALTEPVTIKQFKVRFVHVLQGLL
jgi:hypothetical protein